MTSVPDRRAGRAQPESLTGPAQRRLDRRPIVALLSLVALGALTVARLGDDAAPTLHEFTGHTMGTSFNVKVDADLRAGELDRVQQIIEVRLDQIDRLMSTYDSASELSRFNRHLSTEPFPIGAELFAVLKMAREVGERSGGAFDVTVGGLVDAWGFGAGVLGSKAPGESHLEELRENVGYRRIVLDRAAGTASKAHPGTVVDLSAIAKGYAAERVASDLVGLGLTRSLVEVGGELKATGTKRDGSGWRVGIEVPDEAARSLYGTVDLIDQAIATSGDYRNFRESEGVRYGHIIDPRTGSPIEFSGVSVSVVHPNAALADAWATALTALGPVAGYDLAQREGVAALFVERSNEGFRSRTTRAFTERLGIFQEVGER